MLCNVPEITKPFKFSCSNFSLFPRNVQQIWKSRRQDARHQFGELETWKMVVFYGCVTQLGAHDLSSGLRHINRKACIIEKWSSVSESNFQQLWLKVQCKKFKSFLLCTVYRPPDAPIDFLENLSETFVDSLLHGSNVIILGHLNCNLIGSDPDGHALSDFCSTFGLSQLAIVKTATRVTENPSHLQTLL